MEGLRCGSKAIEFPSASITHRKLNYFTAGLISERGRSRPLTDIFKLFHNTFAKMFHVEHHVAF